MNAIDALRKFKAPVLRAATMAGLPTIVGRTAWRQRRLLILCYHGVSLDDEHEWNPELFVSQEQLRRRFERLQRLGCTVLPLGEGVARMMAGTLPPRSVVLTFDDGNFDFYARALPVLSEFNFPATVYLTTFYSGHQLPVFDVALDYVLWKAGPSGEVDTTGLPGRLGTLSWTSPSERKTVVALIRNAVKLVDDASVSDNALKTLCSRLGVSDARIREMRMLHLMNATEIRSLPGSVSVQLHTHRHRVPDEPESFHEEILKNRHRIAEMREQSEGLHHFCYPSGVSFENALTWLRELDVVTATTCIPGLAGMDSNSLLLPRLIDTMMLSETEFDSWVTGFSGLLPSRAGRNAAG